MRPATVLADDCTLNANSESHMQYSMDQLSRACDNFGLTISTKKTEVTHQPTLGKQYAKPSIQVHGSDVNVVEKFKNVGSTLSRAVHRDDEIDCRIAKASTAFGKFRNNIWECRSI